LVPFGPLAFFAGECAVKFTVSPRVTRVAGDSSSRPRDIAPSFVRRSAGSFAAGMGRSTPRARGAKTFISEFSSTLMVSGVGLVAAIVVARVVVVVARLEGWVEEGAPTRIEITAMLPISSEQRDAEIKLPLGKSMTRIVLAGYPRQRNFCADDSNVH